MLVRRRALRVSADGFSRAMSRGDEQQDAKKTSSFVGGSRNSDPMGGGFRIGCLRGVTMHIKEKAADRCKRPAAQNQTLSNESRWQGYSTQFVLRDQEATCIERNSQR
jgi:hypothetical protein